MLGHISSGCPVIRNRLHFKRSLHHAWMDVWWRLETVLEMRGLSVELQEKMIKIGSDRAQFSHLPPTQRLHLLDHYECTGRTQREQHRVSNGGATGVLERKIMSQKKIGKDICNAQTCLQTFSDGFHINLIFVYIC